MNPPGIEWTPSEAAAINEFLNSPLGRKWMGVLVMRKPRVDLTNSDRAALTGAYAAGYESIFGEIAATRIALRADETASVKAIDPSRD